MNAIDNAAKSGLSACLPSSSSFFTFNDSHIDFNNGTHLSTMSHCATFLMKEHPDLPFIDFEGGTRFSEPPANSVITPTHGRKGLKQIPP